MEYDDDVISGWHILARWANLCRAKGCVPLTCMANDNTRRHVYGHAIKHRIVREISYGSMEH
jgi:hypothetical protein